MVTAVILFNNKMKVVSVLMWMTEFLRRSLFSSSQDEKLKKLVEQHGTDSWKLIANFFPVSI